MTPHCHSMPGLDFYQSVGWRQSVNWRQALARARFLSMSDDASVIWRQGSISIIVSEDARVSFDTRVQFDPCVRWHRNAVCPSITFRCQMTSALSSKWRRLQRMKLPVWNVNHYDMFMNTVSIYRCSLYRYSLQIESIYVFRAHLWIRRLVCIWESTKSSRIQKHYQRGSTQLMAK